MHFRFIYRRINVTSRGGPRCCFLQSTYRLGRVLSHTINLSRALGQIGVRNDNSTTVSSSGSSFTAPTAVRVCLGHCVTLAIFISWILTKPVFSALCTMYFLLAPIWDQSNEGPQLRKSCDYCVRMKRGCDGGTPCELCRRRNKECVHSIKKRSGPAKVYWLFAKCGKEKGRKPVATCCGITAFLYSPQEVTASALMVSVSASASSLDQRSLHLWCRFVSQ